MLLDPLYEEECEIGPQMSNEMTKYYFKNRKHFSYCLKNSLVQNKEALCIFKIYNDYYHAKHDGRYCLKFCDADSHFIDNSDRLYLVTLKQAIKELKEKHLL